MDEPTVFINGRMLSKAEAMTVRVAIENLASDLQGEGLGDDEHGQSMTTLYLKSIDSIRDAMGVK